MNSKIKYLAVSIFFIFMLAQIGWCNLITGDTIIRPFEILTQKLFLDEGIKSDSLNITGNSHIHNLSIFGQLLPNGENCQNDRILKKIGNVWVCAEDEGGELSKIQDIWVNETGDTMTGNLIINNHNLSIINGHICLNGECIDNLTQDIINILGGFKGTVQFGSDLNVLGYSKFYSTLKADVVSGRGIEGFSSDDDGIMGNTTAIGKSGVYGETNADGAAISGRAYGTTESYGLKGYSQNSYSGFFEGGLGVLIKNALNIDGKLKGIKPDGSYCNDGEILKYNQTENNWYCAEDKGGIGPEGCCDLNDTLTKGADASGFNGIIKFGGNLDIGGNKITNVLPPTADSDVATMGWVEAYVGEGGGPAKIEAKNQNGEWEEIDEFGYYNEKGPCSSTGNCYYIVKEDWYENYFQTLGYFETLVYSNGNPYIVNGKYINNPKVKPYEGTKKTLAISINEEEDYCTKCEGNSFVVFRNDTNICCQPNLCHQILDGCECSDYTDYGTLSSGICCGDATTKYFTELRVIGGGGESAIDCTDKCGDGNIDRECGEVCDDGGTSWTSGDCAADCSGRNHWNNWEIMIGAYGVWNDEASAYRFCQEQGYIKAIKYTLDSRPGDIEPGVVKWEGSPRGWVDKGGEDVLFLYDVYCRPY